jgi:hypothetical protein
LKKRSFWISAAVVLAAAAALAGCGSTTYFNGRTLPPSKLLHRVLVAIQNPSAGTGGALEIIDAYYDIRFAYNNSSQTFSISSYSGSLPATIQNLAEEELGVVYGTGDNSLALIDYAKESSSGSGASLGAAATSVFMTRDKQYIFAAVPSSHVLYIYNRNTSTGYTLSLPGVYRLSVNPGGTALLAFRQNANDAYYLRALTSAQTLEYAGGSTKWPKAAVDCEPMSAPKWCAFQVQSPDSTDSTGNTYGAALNFDRPVKALFSSDGGTAYVLSCGEECGGTSSKVTILPVAPLIFTAGEASGKLPKTGALTEISVPGGASNALIYSSTMYVIGQQLQSDGLFTGKLTVVNLKKNTAGSAIGISDGLAGATSRMVLADDDTLWIGMTKCDNGERYAKSLSYGCLTMFDTSTNSVKLIEPYLGDATGIAAVTGLNKVYVAQGGQLYIYKTTTGASLDNQYVTVTGTAYDAAYIDAASDSNNTVY